MQSGLRTLRAQSDKSIIFSTSKKYKRRRRKNEKKKGKAWHGVALEVNFMDVVRKFKRTEVTRKKKREQHALLAKEKEKCLTEFKEKWWRFIKQNKKNACRNVSVSLNFFSYCFLYLKGVPSKNWGTVDNSKYSLTIPMYFFTLLFYVLWKNVKLLRLALHQKC